MRPKCFQFAFISECFIIFHHISYLHPPSNVVTLFFPGNQERLWSAIRAWAEVRASGRLEVAVWGASHFPADQLRMYKEQSEPEAGHVIKKWRYYAGGCLLIWNACSKTTKQWLGVSKQAGCLAGHWFSFRSTAHSCGHQWVGLRLRRFEKCPLMTALGIAQLLRGSKLAGCHQVLLSGVGIVCVGTVPRCPGCPQPIYPLVRPLRHLIRFPAMSARGSEMSCFWGPWLSHAWIWCLAMHGAFDLSLCSWSKLLLKHPIQASQKGDVSRTHTEPWHGDQASFFAKEVSKSGAQSPDCWSIQMERLRFSLPDYCKMCAVQRSWPRCMHLWATDLRFYHTRKWSKSLAS